MITCEQKILPAEDTVLYRDDGLTAVVGNGHEIDKLRKQLIASFKKFGLTITCVTNIKQVCFLDVCLDLNTELHKPYVKKNSKIKYVAKGSNHPGNILKKYSIKFQ